MCAGSDCRGCRSNEEECHVQLSTRSQRHHQLTINVSLLARGSRSAPFPVLSCLFPYFLFYQALICLYQCRNISTNKNQEKWGSHIFGEGGSLNKNKAAHTSKEGGRVRKPGSGLLPRKLVNPTCVGFFSELLVSFLSCHVSSNCLSLTPPI